MNPIRLKAVLSLMLPSSGLNNWENYSLRDEGSPSGGHTDHGAPVWRSPLEGRDGPVASLRPGGKIACISQSPTREAEPL